MGSNTARVMPAQKPHRSKQDYGTPWELIKAVESRWGSLGVDLAATNENAKAPRHYNIEQDSLKQPWHLLTAFRLWLNPPFEDIGAWARKCKEESKLGARIIMLTPASVGSEWFAAHCFGVAHVIGLRPRIIFEGCKDPYPKDCMLTLWGFPDVAPGFDIWRWK